MIKMKLVRKSSGKLEEMAENLTKEVMLKVGFLESATYPDGTPVALVAAVNEYGNPARNQPARPFFRQAIEQNESDWQQRYTKLLIANRWDPATALKQLGEIIKADVQLSISRLESPPLDAATIKRKGFAKPLIDTGTMLRNVDFEVTDE